MLPGRYIAAMIAPAPAPSGSEPSASPNTPGRPKLTALRWVGLIEGVSFLLLLFVAMPLKYAAGMPEAVSLVGMAHGILFLAYVVMAMHAALNQWISAKMALACVVAAVLPFGPFVVDRRLKPSSSDSA